MVVFVKSLSELELPSPERRLSWCWLPAAHGNVDMLPERWGEQGCDECSGAFIEITAVAFEGTTFWPDWYGHDGAELLVRPMPQRVVAAKCKCSLGHVTKVEAPPWSKGSLLPAMAVGAAMWLIASGHRAAGSKS